MLLKQISSSEGIPQEIVKQHKDNLRWLQEADKHKMVVGSQARILYSDQQGRVAIALAFNKAVATGELKVSMLIRRMEMKYSGPVISERLLGPGGDQQGPPRCQRHG